MNTRKFTFIFALFFLLLFFVPGQIHAEYIKSFHTKITVNTDAAIRVEETIDYDFGMLSRHGIYRAIPRIKVNQDGKQFRLDFSSFSVTDRTGNPYRFTQSGSGDVIQLKIGDAATYVTGLQSYVISYTVKGAVTYFSEHDELYWNMTGNEWEVPIIEASGEVILPEGVTQKDIQVKCFTGPKGSTKTNCTASTEPSGISKIATAGLSVGEGLTVVVGFPPGHVARLEPVEIVSFSDTIFGKMLLFLLGVFAFIWYIGLPISIPLIWFLWGRDPKGLLGTVSAWYDPPKDKKGRPLTPGETGLLVDENVDIRDLFASIIHLAQRGYLKIVEKKKNDFYFVKEKEYQGDRSLLEYEKTLLDGIFSGTTRLNGVGDAIAMVTDIITKQKAPDPKKEARIRNLNMSAEVTKATDQLYERMTREGFFPKNPQSVRNFWYLLAVLALLTGNIFLAVELFVFARVMPKKTLFGVGQANVGKSLKNFLSTQERQLEFQAKNQMFFEKLLPYAIAFGVEKVWADRFKDIQLHNPDWYQSYDSRAFTTAYFLGSMNSSFSNFRTSATPTRSSSGFSSGFSSGGGFSGGGGGGGGGGSW